MQWKKSGHEGGPLDLGDQNRLCGLYSNGVIGDEKRPVTRRHNVSVILNIS